MKLVPREAGRTCRVLPALEFGNAVGYDPAWRVSGSPSTVRATGPVNLVWATA